MLDKAGIGGLVANLIKVVAQNRRLFAVPDMIAAFGRLLAAPSRRGHGRGHQRRAAVRRPCGRPEGGLKASLGKDVALETRVDPSLIGGLIVKVGSRMIDRSLKTKLNSLKLAMKEVG